MNALVRILLNAPCLSLQRHPDGVASVSFKEATEADLCKLTLNGRWFGGRQLSAETWDGVTDYQVTFLGSILSNMSSKQ